MIEVPSLARFAGLLAHRSRASICLALLDGRAWTVTEVARHAEISPSTASEHLSTLLGAGLLAEERQGRHRVRLAGPDVAQLVEDLDTFGGVAERPRSLRTVRVAARRRWPGPATTTSPERSASPSSTRSSQAACSTAGPG